MSADIANTTLAAAPYFDDFDESKKFHRVLFRPSYPVQARELTQLQSILQNQIERFGDGVFKTGSIIKGCAPTVISDASYFAVPDDFDVSNTAYEYKIAYGTTSGVQARILKGISGFVNTPSPPKFIVKYTSVGKGGAKVFQQGETIEIYDAEQSYVGKYNITVASATGFVVGERIRGRTSDARGTITAINGTVISIADVRGDFLNNEAIELISNVSVFTIASNVAIDFTTATNLTGAPLATTSVVTTAQAGINYTPVGNAYALGISEGVVYQKGFFIKTEPQVLVLNSSAGGKDAADGLLVGIETTETIVNEFSDTSLYDNSNSLSNDTAPGAHRLKLDTNFVSYAKGSEPTEEIFFAIGEFGTNNILRWNTTSIAGKLNDELAQRTYDESGHYTVKDFSVSTKPSANTQQFEYVIGDGKAYVRGNPIKFDTVQTLVSRRGTDTESPIQQIVSMNYGSYVTAQELRGYFPADTSAEVKLYDTFQNAISTSKNSGTTPDGSQIGTANIRAVIFDDETHPQGSPNARYKLYLFNIKMNTNKSFFDVRSVIYDGGAVKAFADVAVSDSFSVVSGVTIIDGGANYVTGDTVIVSGGEGAPAKLVLSVTGGVVTSVGIIDPGRYILKPTELNTTPVSTTGGNGTGLQIALEYDGEVESRLEESSYTPLVFGLTNRAVKSLKNKNEDSDTKFYYNLTTDTALTNTGTLSISISDGGSFFGFTDGTAASKRKVELVTTEALETVNLTGTVSATSNTTITGSGTTFDLDFVVGETIRFNGTNNVITAIISNTSLVVGSPVTVSSNTYTRVHPAGSVISLDNNNRTISIDPGLQTLSVDLNASNTSPIYAWSGTKGIKTTFYARKVNARPINKIVKRNQLVRFYNGSLGGTISSSGNVVTGANTLFTTDLKAGNYIRANGQTRKVSLVSNNTQLQLETAFVSNLAANTPYEIVHPFGFNMGVPDVFKINRISKTETANDDVNSTASDIQKFFNVDFGQRDTHYDHAVLTPKPTIDLSNTHLLVDFDCFEANASIGKGFFSVESYDINDEIGADTSKFIRTWEIPTFYSQARQRDFDLRDAVDFRPYRSNTAVLTSDPAATTINPPTTTSFNTATTSYNPYPGQNFECNLTYYLPRRDALVLTSKGEFRVIEGEAKLQPRTPNADSETQMVIATTYIPPYPSLTTLEAQTIKIEPYTMKVSPSINKRFTMKDISAIEQRVSSLEYYTTLTRLEQKVTQLNIPNADGIDRFKNGIFVDPFDNHNLARINDPEHQIVIDSQLGVGRPKVSVETVQLELAANNSNSLVVIRDSVKNVAYNRNFLTVDYVPNTVFLEQAHATREIPIDSDDRFLFGSVDLDKEIFSDVEQFRTYPNREYGAAYDSYETNANYTVELIYPTSRTIKILARGLKPNARHYIGVDGVDYSYKATQGFIQLGNDEVAENIVVDGVEGQELYADSNGRLYAILTLPGNIGLGNHLLVVADVVASAISNGLCSSRALGSFVVNSVDEISDYPPEPKPPLPKTGLLVADFDVVGSLSVEEGQDHVLSFLDKTNRGVIAPEGSIIETPVAWEWTFVHCSTGCVDASAVTSSDPNPENIIFTYSSVIETVNVKLKVTGSGGTVSEVVKPIQLTKYTGSQDFKLTIHNQLPGSDNDYYAAAGSVLKATNYLHLNFKVERIRNTYPGGRCELTFTSNKSGGAVDPNGRWEAINVGTVETTNNKITSTGGLHVGLRWKGANVQDTTLEIQADYYDGANNNVGSLTKYISWTKTGVLTPCKPCESTAFSEPVITPISKAAPGTAQEINIRPIGDVLTYKGL